jgi:hypothetical protein
VPLFAILNSIYNCNNKQKHITVAHLGCGNSTLQEDILKTYPIFDFEVVNMDYSEALIKEMQQQAKEKGLVGRLKYEVCDLLKPVGEEWCGRFDLVLDKGTLDAILPEDRADNIQEIKEVYFGNVERMLDPKKKGHVVIISMLQEFVLKTVLDAFHPHPNFAINIVECALPDSQLQPFLVDLAYTPAPQAPAPIRLTLLTKAVLTFGTPAEAIAKIA